MYTTLQRNNSRSFVSFFNLAVLKYTTPCKFKRIQLNKYLRPNYSQSRNPTDCWRHTSHCAKINFEKLSKKKKSILFLQLLTINLKRDGITHKSWPISPESAAISPDTEPADARLAFKGIQLQYFLPRSFSFNNLPSENKELLQLPKLLFFSW